MNDLTNEQFKEVIVFVVRQHHHHRYIVWDRSVFFLCSYVNSSAMYLFCLLDTSHLRIFIFYTIICFWLYLLRFVADFRAKKKSLTMFSLQLLLLLLPFCHCFVSFVNRLNFCFFNTFSCSFVLCFNSISFLCLLFYCLDVQILHTFCVHERTIFISMYRDFCRSGCNGYSIVLRIIIVMFP